MRLVMFDVDGTLIQWNDIDRICFSDAVMEVLGIDEIDTNWAHYTHVTDSGITSEIIEKSLSRRAEERDLTAVRLAYIRELQHEIRNDAPCFQAVPGAFELVSALCSNENISVCLATGGWRASALIKLEVAGISTENIPLASAGDSHERAGIMIRAYERVRVHKRCSVFDSVLYFGDAVWDFVNSKKLGYGFVGIGSGDHARELSDTGVVHVMPDFTDRDYVFRVLGITKY
jgi:phosphoglycolate phosphatase-like HAD superfamily hydrolase